MKKASLLDSFRRLFARGISRKVQPPPAQETECLFASGTSPEKMLAVLERLREKGPIHCPAGKDERLVTDYALARKVLREHHLFSSRPVSVIEELLIGADPPEHGRVRSLLQPRYSPRQLETIHSFLETLVREKLDELARQPSFDLVECLAIPLAVETNDRVLGIGKGISQSLYTATPGGVFFQLDHLQDETKFAFFEEFLLRDECPPMHEGTIPQLRKMVRAGTLTHAQAVRLSILLWIAGSGTVSVLLGNIGKDLLTNPAIRDRLRRQPDRIGHFVEENLRLHPPAHQIARTTTRPMEIGGQEIKEDELLHISTIAANRDPAMFTNPNAYDLERSGSRHLSFGYGAHTCLGNQQARMLAWHFTTAFLPLADRLEPNPTEPVVPFRSVDLCGYARYPVRWKQNTPA
ncbi:MAG: hypothetical protein RLY31_823 [Bacteroidota bacterium]|jgi:cytochrome P450